MKDLNIIINTEHGPKGGDEININFLDRTIRRLTSDGMYPHMALHYDGTDPVQKIPYVKYGFIEPFKYYVPSIGISQIVYTCLII